MYKRINNDLVCEDTGEIISPHFEGYESPYDFEQANVVAFEPMTAKEFLNEEELETMLNSSDYFAEEKLDGTRATMHLRNDGARLFSRRISKKTNWYVENSDSVPHLRDIEIPEELYGTILDGEMLIRGKEFKDVSSTLNCTWDKAIERQIDLGFITFCAFDIIYYKGIYIAKMPLHKRKMYLNKVIGYLNNDYIINQPHTEDTMLVNFYREMLNKYQNGEIKESSYPNLYKTIKDNFSPMPFSIKVDKRTWYEYVVFTGGEGIMLKHKDGTYKHTRGREYTKLKKFDTWDCVVLDYVAPTKEYTGKELATWEYYEDNIPVTKHHYMGWIGTVKYGVLINEEEFKAWKKANPKEKEELVATTLGTFLVVGEASGFDEDTRKIITDNKDKFRYSVIELKAQEVLKTGKLRHPRFLRFRPDKEAERCLYKDHIRK